MNRCPVCSAPYEEGAVLCMRCGAELRRGAGAQPGGSTVPATPLMVRGSTVNDPAPPHLAPAPRVDPAPGSVAAPSAPLAHVRLAPGLVVDGKYRLERVLGEGGMGVVFLAQDLNTDAHVVVKSLHADLAGNEEFRARVRAEARALAHIDHPNVVRLNAVVATDQALLLVMQFVDGESLDKTIERRVAAREPVGLVEALTLVRQIVMGVGAAHREGVVHRDIKPGNVLLRKKDGVAKVTDFGIAKSEDDAKAGRGVTRGIIGSLWYMSPEQVSGQRDLDKRVDIYALGILFFELLMGRVPFDADSEYEIMKLHIEGELPSISAARPDIPPRVDEIVRRACAKRREDRYASCEEMLADIDALLLTVAPHALGTAVHAVATTSAQVPPPPPAHGVSGPHATTGGATTRATETPPEPRSGVGAKVAIAVVAVVALVGVAAIVKVIADGNDAGPAASTTSTTKPPPSTTASGGVAPKSDDPLAALVGKWKSDSGRHYEAVLTPGGDLEFRVRDPSEFEGQNYIEGEPRFTLRKGTTAGVLAVEDKIRPLPPKGLVYEPQSRGTCQEDWTEVAGKPLVARFDGKRLQVDLVKVTPDRAMFETTGNKVTSCSKISKSSATKIESVLDRE